MLIVDSQVHVWQQDHPEAIPRHGDRPLMVPDVLAELRAAGVQRAVLVPPYWVGYDNGYALKAAREHPEHFAVMGRIDLAQVRDSAWLARWREQPGLLGARLLFNQPETRPYLLTDAGDRFWGAAQDLDLPVMLHAPGELPAVARLARRFPRLRLALDHLGIGRAVRGEPAFAHLDDLLRLAELPNVSVKVSAVPVSSGAPYPYRDLHGFLRRVFDAFGTPRLFWGSDLSRLPCSYRLCVDLFVRELDWLTGADLERFMGRSLCDWIGWPAA